MDQVNENTSCVITVSFMDEDGRPVTPSSASYRVDDSNSGTAILEEIAINPGGPTYSIEVNQNDNRIINPANEVEERCLTLFYTYGDEKGASAEKRWLVKNLWKAVPET